MRILLDLPDHDLKALDQLRERHGMSRSDIVGLAVRQLLLRETESSADDAFGLWRRKGPDGLEHQIRLRSEWTPA